MSETKNPFQPGGPERYAHQKRGLKKLLETGGIGALLFDPGLGKTATSFDYASILALKLQREPREARVLVVAPLAAIDTWVLQAELWASPQVNVWAEALGGSISQRAEALASRGGQNYAKTMKSPKYKRQAPRAVGVDRSLAWFARANDRGRERPITPSEGPDGLGTERPKLILVSVNLDTFASRQAHTASKTKADLILDAVRRYSPDLVIVDESHKIKGATSNTSRLMDRVGQRVPRRMLLTGTVMPTSPLDVFAQWRFLDPFAFGELQPDGSHARSTYESFKRRFAVLGGYMGREVVGYRNLDEMHSIMAKRASVARKAEALDLPPATPVIVPVNLSPREQQAYDDMKKNLSTQFRNDDGTGTTSTTGNRLTQLMRLRQITSGHLPDDMGVVHLLGDSKVKTIDSIVNDTLIGESRVVVFCVFTHEIEALELKLARPGTVIMKITGGTPKDDRLKMRKRFGTDEPTRMVLIAQIKTISLSVNELVTASNAVFGSLSQQRDDQIQAQDRLNRIGQKNAMTFWFPIVLGSVDEVIMKAHKDRTNLENAMLRHIFEGEGNSNA